MNLDLDLIPGMWTNKLRVFVPIEHTSWAVALGATPTGEFIGDFAEITVWDVGEVAVIRDFRGEHSFLSNFAECFIWLRGVLYHSVEAAFQSEKNPSAEWKKFCSDNKRNSVAAIRAAGRMIKLRSDWHNVKDAVMEYCVKQKFKQEPFRSKLLDIPNDCFIVEGNTWGDTYWGADLRMGGRNKLGNMIMQLKATMHYNLRPESDL